MTDIHILVIGIVCALVLAGYLLLCERVRA